MKKRKKKRCYKIKKNKLIKLDNSKRKKNKSRKEKKNKNCLFQNKIIKKKTNNVKMKKLKIRI